MRKEKLSLMIAYSEGEVCLRRYMLSYFGEKSENCGNCSVCTGLKRSVDITVPAQKIFSCIKRLKEKEKKETVCNILKGNVTADIKERQLDSIRTFGAMSDTAESVINEHIDYFIERGYINISPSGSLFLSDKCKDILFGERKLRKEEQRPAKRSEEKRADPQLYVKLKKLRSECAKKASVPYFIIFTDATLLCIARHKPKSFEEFSKIPGVSLSKLKKYGVIFIKAINKHCSENVENKKIN